MRAPARITWTIIWLSKTKSSELRSKGSAASRSRLNARRPVWYSDSFWWRSRFSNAVSSRFGYELVARHAPRNEFCARMREPRTKS